MQRPNAIIFDLDGVLTDTSDYHYEAWKHLADDLGIPFTREENDKYLRGVSRRDSLMYIIRGRHYTEDQIQEMMDRKNRYYVEMIQKMTPNDLVPGGKELLQEIQNAGIKIAIASVSKNARTVIDHLDINVYLNAIADGYAVTNGKPAPDIFVFAAGQLNTPTSQCLVLEDAAAGVEAAKRGGMLAIGIGPQDRFQGADKVLPDLVNKHLQDLLE